MLFQPPSSNFSRLSKDFLGTGRKVIAFVSRKVVEIVTNFINRFRDPVFASRYYRYLARQVAMDVGGIDGGKAIVFSAATDMDTSSEVLLMFSHFLQDELSSSVLIIDATFRNSGLSQLLGLGDREGIVDILSGDSLHTDFESITHSLKGRMSFIASGPVKRSQVPYATEEQVNSLLEVFRSQYDYVILQQDNLKLDTRYLPYAKAADLVLLHLEERSTAIASFDEIKDVLMSHQIRNVKYILSER
ncbi:MAG: hypothetical protein AB8B81_13105 [Halioglobus sp.]